MAWEIFDLKKEDGVAIATMSRSPGNTYNLDLMHELDEVIEEVRFDTDVKVIVLTGGGEKFFSAGADINMLQMAEPRYKASFCLHCNETLQELERIPKLVIAALNGHCVGGGLEIALACDMRVMSRDGGRIGLPEVNLGVLPGTGGSQRLPRVVGKAKALELMVTGDLLSPEDAERIGLVNKALPDDELLPHALAMARRLADGPIQSIRTIKRAVRAGQESDLPTSLGFGAANYGVLALGEDHLEAVDAFLEKRTPKFKG